MTAAGLTGCAANKMPSADGSAPDAAAPETTTAAGASSAPSNAAPAPAAPTSAAPVTTGPTSIATTAAVSSTAASTGGPAKFINHGARDSGAMALTFHAAGDIGRATALLDLLKRAGAPVTVFAVGSWIEANPQVAKRILADGHELANHTWSHGAMRTMSRADLNTEISKAANTLTKVSGSNGRWFRPSQIEVPTNDILAEAGKAGYGVSVGYDLDSMDFQDPGAAAVRANVIGHVQSGSIISLHFDHQNTIEALPAILEHLKSKSLKPVTISQLIG
jgi:peptidoglycan/xylan/chitin deacetylase (PgdA/CDA1 family)